MQPGRASRTAEHNALFRTLEMSFPPDARICDDPYAAAFLTRPLSSLRPIVRLPGASKAVASIIDRRWPGVRTSVVARTRLIDETLTGMGSDELAQLVILGAGYDSRAERLARLNGVPVFEVDHPDTQVAKRAAIRRRAVPVPESVRFVPSDFNLTDGRLDKSLASAGHRPDQPTVFLWEGVTNYLTEQAVDATLRWCAQIGAAGSQLIVTYVDSAVLDHPESFVGGERLHTTLAKVGERLTFGRTPEAMGEFLTDRGFTAAWDLGAAEYRCRAYGARSARMVGHEFYRVALASRTA